MTLAIVLVVFATVAFAVIGILCAGFLKCLPIFDDAKMAERIQPLDLEAFRNLIDPAEREYLRRRLRPAEFREVQRERLRAMAEYVQVAARNASILVTLAQSAIASNHPETAEAARQLTDNAARLRWNAFYALARLQMAAVWPECDMAAAPILRRYVQLNGTAMLLGRLQNPGSPFRISAR